MNATTAPATVPRRAAQAPGPKGVPLLGSLGPWRRNTAEFLLGLQRDHGETVRMRLGPMTVHQITGPEAVQQVLVKNHGNYVRGPLYEQFSVVMGKGLLTSDGDFWRGHRRAVQPAFQKNTILDIVPNIVTATNEMLDGWEAKAARDEPVDLMTEMLRLTLITLSRSLFAYDIEPSSRVLKHIVDDVVEVMFRRGTPSEMLPSWLPTDRKHKITRIHRVFDKIVADVRQNYARTGEGSLISLMEQAEDPVTGEPWTDQELRDELLTIYLAGHETTAVSLCWILLSIANQPPVQEELDAEVAQVLGGDLPDRQNTDALTYTRMVVDESLRMHPPIWIFPRAAVGPDSLGGYDIEAGSSILLSPLVSHHNPRHWDNPLAFDPYRFTAQAVKERPRMAYFPFGAGPRQCIGNTMALLELRTIVTMINQRFKLSMIPGHALRYGSPVISLRPIQDVMVRLTARERTAPGRNRPAPPLTPATTAATTTTDAKDTLDTLDTSSARAEGCPAHRGPGPEAG